MRDEGRVERYMYHLISILCLVGVGRSSKGIYHMASHRGEESSYDEGSTVLVQW